MHTLHYQTSEDNVREETESAKENSGDLERSSCDWGFYIKSVHIKSTEMIKLISTVKIPNSNVFTPPPTPPPPNKSLAT